MTSVPAGSVSIETGQEPYYQDESATLHHGDCLDVATHTTAPTRYGPWHEWAAQMAKSHDQIRCGTCGFYVIWRERVTA